MRKTISIWALFLIPVLSPAQRLIMSVGSTKPLTIRTGTIFSADSLVLIPGTDYTMSSNTVQVSPIAVIITPTPSINRVYYLGNAISFTGTLQLYYQLSELNGNNESTLKYTDSAISSVWTAQVASTVNTGSHYVEYIVSARSFIASTASQPPVPLALSILSFAGNWDRDDPSLSWAVDGNGEEAVFTVESCADGSSWKGAGTVQGLRSPGTNTYYYSDKAAKGPFMYYRIRLEEVSGRVIYSNVIKLQKGDNSSKVLLAAGRNSVLVSFSGEIPSAVRLISAAGQLLRSERSGRQQYELDSLIPGVYFLQYMIRGQWLVREFVIQ